MINNAAQAAAKELDKEYKMFQEANKLDNLNYDYAYNHCNDVAVWEKLSNRRIHNHCGVQGLYALLNLGVSDQARKVAEDIMSGKVFTREQQLELEKKVVRSGTPQQILALWEEMKKKYPAHPTYFNYGYPQEMFGLKGTSTATKTADPKAEDESKQGENAKKGGLKNQGQKKTTGGGGNKPGGDSGNQPGGDKPSGEKPNQPPKAPKDTQSNSQPQAQDNGQAKKTKKDRKREIPPPNSVDKDCPRGLKCSYLKQGKCFYMRHEEKKGADQKDAKN